MSAEKQEETEQTAVEETTSADPAAGTEAAAEGDGEKADDE